jgi:hypothetical protein
MPKPIPRKTEPSIPSSQKTDCWIPGTSLHWLRMLHRWICFIYASLAMWEVQCVRGFSSFKLERSCQQCKKRIIAPLLPVKHGKGSTGGTGMRDGMIRFGHDALKGLPPLRVLYFTYRGSPKIGFGSICVSRTVPMEAQCRLL